MVGFGFSQLDELEREMAGGASTERYGWSIHKTHADGSRSSLCPDLRPSGEALTLKPLSGECSLSSLLMFVILRRVETAQVESRSMFTADGFLLT